MYLCYDIKGIQQFIFSVPKLKCVIGASGLIVQFDDSVEEIGSGVGATCIFSGGGRGVFACGRQSNAEDLERKLVKKAHGIGLDIRISTAENLPEAMHRADRLYPYCPKELEGEPCTESGLWPVPPQTIPNVKKGVHELIWRRITEAKNDPLGEGILKQLREQRLIPKSLSESNLMFFKNVSPDPEGEEDETAEAKASQAALGDRNRWAVIAMDGNDMGRQFKQFEALYDKNGWQEEQHHRWLTSMSQEIKECTRKAFLTALGHVLTRWADNAGGEQSPAQCVVDEQGIRRYILPFRPLILGGDDVILLCHSAYAMEFVEVMAKTFSDLSQQAAKQAMIDTPLWPATNGVLTMSAGILYCKVTFPLHMAIPYAESLLASAKGTFRADPKTTDPTPAAVDWEAITETLVDTPAARRNRELRFHDEELGIKIHLTQRPYLIQPFSGRRHLDWIFQLKKDLAGIPPSVRARILPALQRPWSERIAFLASIAKRHPSLKKQLWEDENGQAGDGWVKDDGKSRITGLPDALLLLEEEHRMDRPTG